jgi:hypothetical protein
MRVPSYPSIQGWLQALYWLADLVEIGNYLEVASAGSDSPISMKGAKKLLEGIGDKLGDLFPVHDFYLEEALYYEFDSDLLDIGYIGLTDIVHFEGLDVDREWDDWYEAFKLAIALLNAGEPAYPGIYDGELRGWWEKQSERFELPPLGEVDLKQVVERVKALPAPWNGLFALLRWVGGDTGNLFVDISCGYAHQVVWLDWSVETIRDLQQQYGQAKREIFDPAWELTRLCEDNPQALGVCFDLALGRRSVEEVPREITVEVVGT